ncbi:MAG: radical SAM protein, partial [Bacteroidota bacterium]|nr:radical SAM protein [Bacteroidota bacterium]MDX5430299.1 radical SAM protein [Bacteroidota bacterium]MDX5469060.1 radical SAM protein [Bacteroidota bacterium]
MFKFVPKILALSGIYFHIPFCSKACSYCDFHFSTSLNLKNQVLEAMKKELEIRLETTEWTKLNSLYFGGGTPSLLSAAEIDALLSPLQKRFDLGQIEFTLEANPDDLTLDKLRDFKATGVNRLSI